MEAFRERKWGKVDNDTFLFHLTLYFCGRDENSFLVSSCLKPCANQYFWGHFARRDSGPSSRVVTFPLLSMKVMEFQWFWSPFGPLLRVTDARTHARTDARTEDKPAQRDPLHALGTHPVCGRRPPTPIYVSCNFPVIYGFVSKTWKSIKFNGNHQIFKKSTENVTILEIFEENGKNGWNGVKMAETPPKWPQKRCGHVWDCTKRIYIRFVQSQTWPRLFWAHFGEISAIFTNFKRFSRFSSRCCQFTYPPP